MTPSAPVAEIFSSFQGEGPYVGVRQVFIRLRGCHLTCCYCDTPEARRVEGLCRWETEPGSERWIEKPNPLSADEAAEVIFRLGTSVPHHSVSITGGEPLLHPDFVQALASRLRAAGWRTYLDTAATDPTAMTSVASLIDIVAADYKLPETLREPIPFALFAQTWEAIQGERFVKIVVTDKIEPPSLARHCQQLAELDPEMLVILQPATPVAGCRPPAPAELFALANVAAAILPNLRVIPQCHRILNVR